MPSANYARITATDSQLLDGARELFTQYAEWLAPFITHSTIAEELASLPEPFSAPGGVLIAALDEAGTVCGIVGVKRHSDTECEIKRLFVRPDRRGTGLGYGLFSQALDAAAELGYREVLVSTVPAYMPEALKMYRRFGFGPTERFEDHTHAEIEIAYLRLSLANRRS